MSGKDEASSSDLEEDCSALGDGNVPDESEVAGQWILEHDRILSLDDKAGYVEGSELDPGVLVREIVASAAEVVQPSGNVHDLVAVDEDLELADPVVEVVEVEAAECQKNRLSPSRSDYQYELSRACQMVRSRRVITGDSVSPSADRCWRVCHLASRSPRSRASRKIAACCRRETTSTVTCEANTPRGSSGACCRSVSDRGSTDSASANSHRCR